MEFLLRHSSPVLRVEIPEAYSDLVAPVPPRNLAYYGGRGAARTWTIARYLVARAHNERLRIGCFREFQNSIAESVHATLRDQIRLLGLEDYYRITDKSIESTVGSEFFFRGLAHNELGIKSIEGMDIAWVEEAQSVSKDSIRILRPTVRKEGSFIIWTFNTGEETDPVYQDSVVNKHPDWVARCLTFEDNPWVTKELNEERERDLATANRTGDFSAYDNIWRGLFLVMGDSIVFKGRFEVRDFETPYDARFYHGADWGFANDPLAITRCFIIDNTLFVDMESTGVGIELPDLAAAFNAIPTAAKHAGWPIYADNSRPETISFMFQQGYRISPADKWNGSVEDGVTHLKGFDKIVIHPRCERTISEFKRYSYKIDRKTKEVLPIIVDANNHCIDSLRYGLDKLIKRRAGSVFRRLAHVH